MILASIEKISDFSQGIKIKVKGGNIETIFNMILYKSKVVHVEDGILKVSSIRKNINAHTRKENNCGDDFSMVILYGEHLGDTTIDSNTYLMINIILESRYLVLSYIHIGLHTGDEKYRI